MATKLTVTDGGKVLEIQVTGKLTHEDYRQFVPEFERLIQENGKIRLLFEMIDFHGWEFAALWDDIKLDAKHFAHIERLAMVGDKAWEKGMSVFCRPFTTAKIRYFDHASIADARTWVADRQTDPDKGA
jgi:hypothetical protein